MRCVHIAKPMASAATLDLRWLALAALLSLPAGAQAQVYCCDDNAGRAICADLLPTQCYGRAYRILSPQGTLIRNVGAPLTIDQMRAQREEERRKRIEADKLRAQKLRERALLDAYETIDDIDVQERRALAEVESDIEKARKAEEELLKQRARLAREEEFYIGKTLPPELRKQLLENEQEILAQRSVVESKKKHHEAVRQRYADDRLLYQAILERREEIYRR